LSVVQSLQAKRRRGLVQLVLHHLYEKYIERLRRQHAWLCVVLPTLDSQVCRCCRVPFEYQSRVLPFV
jgi:hypothetical protein